MSTQGEQTVAACRATVLFYDNATKKWSDNQVLSDVEIYQNKANNTFRVSGQSVQNGKNTINVNLVKEVKYSRANEIFIQWRDPETKRVVGLSFVSCEEAALFEQWMSYAISVAGSTPAVQQRSQLHERRPQSFRQTSDCGDAERDRRHMAVSSPTKLLDDITECPICNEFYTDPRVLPCIHTYCLKCIEKWGQNKKPEEKLTCPLCRKEFEIEGKRFADLPKNFFVEKLLEVKKLTAAVSLKDRRCDWCMDVQGRKEMQKASVYCADCRQNLCKACLKSHSSGTVSKSHKQLLEIGAHNSRSEDLLQKCSRDSCDKHPEEILKLYCIECNSVSCVMCYITGHNTHRCADVSQVADDMRKQVKVGCEGLGEIVSKCRDILQELSYNEKAFMENVTKAEKQIIEKSEEMKRTIDSYKMELLQQLATAKKEKEKQMETGRHEVERRVVMLESFKKYSEELTSKGTACDIVRAASGLVERAKELTKFNVEQDLDVNRTVDDIKFVSISSRSLATEMKQIFGEVKVETSQQRRCLEGALADPGELLRFMPSI